MYSEILKEEMGIDSVKDLCIRVELKEIVYPLCFIRKEYVNYLVIDSTGDDGNERVVIIPKSKIISICVVYQQDIDNIFDEDKEEKVMFR